MLRTAILILAVVASSMLSTPSLAESVCGERSRFLDQLHDRFGESPAAIGLVSNGQVLEVLTSENGSWTILLTAPSGLACVMASGESWESLPRLAMGPAA